MRLYTRHDLDTRPEHHPPEIERLDLAGTVLELRAAGLQPENLPWLDPPPSIALQAAEELLRRLAFPHIRSIVFDQMLPKIAHYWPRATVEALLREAGLSDIKLNWVNEMSWSAIGTKPVADAAGR